MKPEKQRIAIFEACGWRRRPDLDYRFVGEWRHLWELDGLLTHLIPDYLKDLNAMHEVEKVLGEERWPAYVWQIYKVVVKPKHNGWWDVNQLECYKFLNATAAQRAEAFLRTIGKWEETP